MGDIGMIKGVLLAWKLCRKGRRIVDDVVDHRGSVGLGVYRREKGGRNNKYKQQMQSQMHDMAARYSRRALMQYYAS
jgi:hypothetical protein